MFPVSPSGTYELTRPSMAPVVDPMNTLTDHERKLMALAWLCFSEKPKVSIAHHRPIPTTKGKNTNATASKPDYKRLAALAGMSNPVSASNAWSKIQKKITASIGNVPADVAPEAQTPKATPAKKRAAAKFAFDGESPAKKTKTPSKAKKVKGEPVDEDGMSRSQSEVEGQGEEDQSFF